MLNIKCIVIANVRHIYVIYKSIYPIKLKHFIKLKVHLSFLRYININV